MDQVQNENKDIVLVAKDKEKFLEQFYKNLNIVKNDFSIEEIEILTKALEVATLEAKAKEKERLRKEAEEKERLLKEAERKKQERLEKLRKAKEEKRLFEEHKKHVESVTCMDLPIDFVNPYENEIIDEKIEDVDKALIMSLDRFGSVDIEYIAKITNKSFKDVIISLGNSIYQNPLTWGECFYKGWETSSEYLSGNILYKLHIAQEFDDQYLGYFARNIKALKELVAPNIAIKDIYISLGSPWIPTKIIDDFIFHLAGISNTCEEYKYFTQDCYKVRHDEYTGIWEIPDKNRFQNYHDSIKFKQIISSIYGTERIKMLDILENTLNQKTLQINDGVDTGKLDNNGKKIIHYFINNDETIKAIEKQEKIIQEFRDWVWLDEERSKFLQNIYCTKFGNIRKRVFDGGFLTFPNLNKNIKLYDYQKNAIARIILTPNTLLAHDVGAGKTFIMIAAGMELRRLGKSKKNLYVVPNNILSQWENNFLKLYPDAKLLIVNDKNFCPKKRTKTLKSIQEDDFDAIIMNYSSFDMLSLSKQYYEKMYQEQLLLLDKASKKFTLKSKIEAKRRAINRALDQLSKNVKKSVCDIPFDELGINTIFLDESHYYKNVPIETLIHRVHGINKAGSEKCEAMMDKIHCVQRQNNGGRIVFATGTPITNSLTDIYVIQKYLQSGELEFAGIQNFDNWVGMFAEKTTEYEIDVDTNSYHLKTRFARFKNIPELTSLLSSIADFHHENNSELPSFNGYTDSIAVGSDIFKDYLKDISNRADDVRQKRVDRKIDNLLKITTDGRKAALDMRLIDQIFGRDSESKVVRCASNILDIYYETRDIRGVQLVFCDSSTPKEDFNLYDELKQLLINFGIPSNEIAFIHEATDEKAKEKLFLELRNGEKSVIIGSTFKAGHGVNIQDRLVALHHLDVPWRPSDMIQREGRILRRGNLSKEVKIFRYITKGSFDAYSWQLLETKQIFISQILSGCCEQRECQDVDETILNYAEVKALAIGNPLIKKRVEVFNQLSKYKILEREERLKREKQLTEINELPSLIEEQKKIISLCEKDISEIDKIIYQENEEAKLQVVAIENRRIALDEKNIISKRYKEIEKQYKELEKELKSLIENKSTQEEIELKQKEIDELEGLLNKTASALEYAKNVVEEARSKVIDDSDSLRELRKQIAQMVKENINVPYETKITTYRGFDIVIPPYMKPHAIKKRNEFNQLVETMEVEPYICLVRNCRYQINIKEEIGILPRINHVIDDLRGKRNEFIDILNDYHVRLETLKKETKNNINYLDLIANLTNELNKLDIELGLKEG